jgi:vitamin B12 transporter
MTARRPFRSALITAVLGSGFAVALGAAFAAPLAAQERDSIAAIPVPPIVVTVSRIETPTDEVANAITVVTRQEIERRQLRTVEEALRTVPGVSLVRSGGPGGTTTSFIRGASSEHALVLLDGIELNDPSLPAGGYDFATLGTAGVERIEILRGPQSTVHGSNALGGVVNIITRRGEGKPRVEAAIEGGGFRTLAGTVAVLGSISGWSWFAAATRSTTDGFSAAPERLGNDEDDASRTTGVDVRLDGRTGPATMSLVGHLDDSATEIDQSGPEGDDPNRRLDDRETAIRAEVRLGEAGDRWRPELSLAWTEHDRASLDDPDPDHPQTMERGDFEGTSWKLSWVNALDLGGSDLVIGAETERERSATSFESDGPFGPFESEFPEQSARTTGAFAEARARPTDALVLAAGARVDDHDRFGATVTGRVAPVVIVGSTGTRLRATAGTGFKAPSLFQLFDPAFGDPGLDPEHSRGWDVGIDQPVASDQVQLSATWFRTNYEGLIVFGSDGYRNENEVTTRGLETTASAVFAAALRVAASYTYTRAESETGADAGLDLIRRPRHQGSLTIDWTPERGPEVSLGLRRVGDREDVDFTTFPSERVSLDAYTIARIAAAWEVADRVRVTGRIENLFDAEYEEVLDFGTAGRAAYLGVAYRP